ncbi:MAG: GNAT family N-acetyltransferase [Candidatus Delongbacteria bacterium]|nr:GNAT family N-acetyltransferase [Candidatus Delongbacteria bacterium]
MKMFSAIDNKTKELVGHVQFLIDKPNDIAGIARMIIAPKQRGKGYGKFVINELLKFGFNEIKLNLINLVVFDLNISAIKCYENCGFIKEGILRDRRKIGNEYWSLVSMSVKKNEYLQRIESKEVL